MLRSLTTNKKGFEMAIPTLSTVQQTVLEKFWNQNIAVYQIRNGKEQTGLSVTRDLDNRLIVIVFKRPLDVSPAGRNTHPEEESLFISALRIDNGKESVWQVITASKTSLNKRSPLIQSQIDLVVGMLPS